MALTGEQRNSSALELARRDPNDFCEWTFRDDQTGQPLKQAWHHREWQALVNQHDRLVMWFPIEHGKTTQCKMTLCRLLGQHPDRQYAYISSKATQAKKTLAAVKREIESNMRLRMVYPDLRPQISALSKAKEEWGKTSIRVHGCPVGSKDPSVAAFGLDGQILGSRLHGAILDNVLDKSNTRSRKQREWILEVIEDEIMGRVMEGGFIWMLDTAWFADDAMHELAKKRGWHSVRFDAEVGETPDEPTLWPSQWSPARLAKTREELGPTAYDRQFRNRPLSESMNWFQAQYWDMSYGRCALIEDEWPMHIDLQVNVRTGMDLATRKGEHNDLTSFATVVARGSRRQLVHMRADKMEGMEILRAMLPIYRLIHRPVNLAGGNAVFVVEDNAAQVYIVQMIRDAAVQRMLGLTTDEAGDIRVIGRTTTSKRRDSELGIQGLASAIEMGRWDFAVHPEVRALREEMKVWSPEADHYGDRLMSMWIAASDLGMTPSSFRVDYI